VAVAGDRFVLGETKPVQGHALYLALEDNERRLKKRTDKILQGTANWPERLEMHTQWKRMDNGGLEDLAAWCQEHPERRLIWIDTLAKIRPVIGRSEQAYAADYRAIEGLQKLAGEYQVGIILNHHLRKMSSDDDAFDDVSGTLGLTGAADTIIVMKRQTGMVKIYVRGRDIEEGEFAAEFNRNTCRWRIVGGADEVFRSQERQAILAVLKDAMRPMSVADIMAATERRDRHATQVLLIRMEKAGEVKHVGRGMWAHPKLDGPDADPSNAGDFGDLVTNGSQAVDTHSKFGADQSHSKVTEGESGDFAVTSRNPTNPLHRNGNLSESHEVTEVTGSDRPAPNGNGIQPPPRGDRWHPAGDMPPGQAKAQVWLKERWPPPLGPEGDDIYDFEPGWR
jgi:hypothetical protein